MGKKSQHRKQQNVSQEGFGAALLNYHGINLIVSDNLAPPGEGRVGVET